MARTAETTSTTLAADAPAALVAWPKTIDVPLSGPKRQNSPEKGRARSTHGAGGRQTHGQTLPTPSHLGSKSQPRTGHTREPDPTPCSLAHHLGPSEQLSRRATTAPVVGLDQFCIDVQ